MPRFKTAGVEEMLLKGRDMIGWDQRGKPEEKSGRYRRGIGVGRSFHTSGTGAPMPGEVIDYSTAMVKVGRVNNGNSARKRKSAREDKGRRGCDVDGMRAFLLVSIPLTNRALAHDNWPKD